MKKLLGMTDHLFLTLEKRQQPIHVGGLFLFKLPDDAPEDFVYQAVQVIRNSQLPPVAPFNQVLSGLFWEKDVEFDLDHHFRHISLPKPGRIRELLTYVSQEHSALIDRAKPLWECHFIEGIEGRRFALYFKVSHGLVDGVAAMRLVHKSFSVDVNDKTTTPIWAITPKKPKAALGSPLSLSSVLLKTLVEQSKSVPNVAKEIYHAINESGSNPYYVSVKDAPQSILNQKISGSRRFAAQSYPLPVLQQLAKRFNVTLNDMILAVCAGALRAYLLSLNALPLKPLIAMVPMSLRDDQTDHGNQIGIILANLATHKADPMQRLNIISRSIDNSKARFSRMSKTEIVNYTGIVYALAGFNLITGVLPKIQAFNVVISNVPGPKQALYLNGAKLDALYPMSVLLDGQALNITLTSYLDNIEVGIVACRKTLPKVQNLLALFQKEIDVFTKRAKYD